MTLDLPQLDRSGREPLAVQIAAHFEAAIRHGYCRPGDKLPTIRRVAEAVGVTRATVQDAYRRLAGAGLVAGTVGRGTTVVASEETQEREPLSYFAAAALRQVQEAPVNPIVPANRAVVANFADLPPASDSFPVDAFAAALQQALVLRGGELLSYGNPLGMSELREYLAGTAPFAEEGIGADDILITTGAQQGIDLVLRAFTSPGDAVAVPVPTYQQLFGLLKSQGLLLEPIRSDARGPDLADLERVLSRRRVRLLCLMPTFHNPTGRTLDLQRRKQVMERVARTGVPVLEDEYEHFLRFTGDTLPSLRSLDPRGWTVTVRTFSKGLFPGIRVGWVQGNPRFLGPMAAVKRFMDLETSPLLQAALLEFLEGGHFDRYLKGLRRSLAVRHRTAQKALAAHMPEGCTWSSPEGGFALWVELPADGAGDRIANRAAEQGVTVTPGRVFDPLGRPSSGFRLSLSRSEPPAIEKAIRILGACARDVLGERTTTHPPLFL